ncbi:MAG: type II toxin-antitoxin system RelE/ParE family toxin [Leptospiraceae bacterium]|nr:hypothetical protein [Leptospiraceae bacterium]MCP5496383.1 type II toxin-antitoxin system RelE/ParE family toxin [Leptospiraceae bacterium]
MDVLEAADWYEQQRIGLGYDFYLNFEDAIELLKSHPYIFQEVYNNFRRTLMKNFPYAIFYSVDEIEKEVEVVGVFNTHRDPEIWKKRIKLKSK